MPVSHLHAARGRHRWAHRAYSRACASTYLTDARIGRCPYWISANAQPRLARVTRKPMSSPPAWRVRSHAGRGSGGGELCMYRTVAEGASASSPENSALGRMDGARFSVGSHG